MAQTAIKADSINSNSVTLATYRPFIIGLTMVFICTFGLATSRLMLTTLNVTQVMNIFMGCFFVVFALPKLSNIPAFAEAFGQYDLISKRFPWYARIFPVIELVLGVALLSDISSRSMPLSFTINAIVALLSGLGGVSVMQSLRIKKTVACACMGSAFTFPLSKVTIAENGVMFVMAAFMLLTMSPEHMYMASIIRLGVIN